MDDILYNLISSLLSPTHSKKFKISAEVKDVKQLLIFSIKQSWTKSCATANHLPEFRLTHNFFKKHEIQHFRYINTCIEHINRNCNLRQFFRIRKFINRTLCILDFVIYNLCITVEMRIFLIKNLEYLRNRLPHFVLWKVKCVF